MILHAGTELQRLGRSAVSTVGGEAWTVAQVNLHALRIHPHSLFFHDFHSDQGLRSAPLCVLLCGSKVIRLSDTWAIQEVARFVREFEILRYRQ